MPKTGPKPSPSTCSQQATRASRSASRASVLDSTTSATSGQLSPAPFATFDHDTSCWRTSAGTFPWGSGEYSETWPVSGTMQSGTCSPRATSAPPISGSGCGSLRGMPTPTAADGKGGPGQSDKRTGGPNLRTFVTMLPTPTAGMVTGGQSAPEGTSAKGRTPDGRKVSMGLGTLLKMGLLPAPVSHGEAEARPPTMNGGAGRLLASSSPTLLPTPTAQDAKNSTLPPSQMDRDSLPGHLLRTLPTPTARDCEIGCEADRASGRLRGAVLPTPTAAMGTNGGDTYGRGNLNLRGAAKRMPPRVESPHDGESGTRKGLRLSPPFVEWMMGFPEGWTDLD